MMLLTLSNASDKTGTYRSGGNMAAPVASSIMAEILPYLGIEPTYSADELVGADHTVPNVVGLKRDEAAAKLIHAGADTYPINKAFFDTKSFARLRLEAELTHSIELYAGGLVGLCTMPKSLLQELGISEDDVDSISGFARSIEIGRASCRERV